MDTHTRLNRGFFIRPQKKTSFLYAHSLLVVLPKVEEKKNPLGERSACLVFELLVFAKNNFFWVFFFACLGVRARWCSGYRGKTCRCIWLQYNVQDRQGKPHFGLGAHGFSTEHASLAGAIRFTRLSGTRLQHIMCIASQGHFASLVV